MARNVGLKIPYDQVWARIGEITGWTRDIELAHFLDVKAGTISGARSRDSFPIQWAYKIAQEFECSTDWLMSGKNENQDNNQDSINKIPVSADNEDEHDIGELLKITHRVLTSQTIYKKALASNIVAFGRSVEMEEEVESLRKEMQEMKAMLQELLEAKRTEQTAQPQGEKKSQAA